MGTEEDDEEIKLNLRLPKELHEAYTQRAKDNRRSLNSEILTVLERYATSPEVGLSLEEIKILLAELANQERKSSRKKIPRYDPETDGKPLTGKLRDSSLQESRPRKAK